MKKMPQLEHSDEAVEGVFWFEEVSAQWRVRGKAVAIGDPDGGQEEKEARNLVQSEMRVKLGGEKDVKGWDLERQVTTYFANHSPIMRGMFSIPFPLGV